uniref:Uncharacterized protein n=1 Tax=Corvus moneduloides TaxID=1196302 RepID=A0A8U7NYY4_CORMO
MNKSCTYGHTLFDYGVGLNDIVQLLIRSESESPTTSVTNQDGEVNPCAVSNCQNKVKRAASNRSPNQPSTSAHLFLIDPGIGLYKVCPNFESKGLILHLSL